MAYELEKQTAIAAVTAAATLCEQVRQTRTAAIEKQDRSPVTIADFAAQAVVCRAIAAAFPQDAIVGEENADLLRQPQLRAELAQVVETVQAIVPSADPEAVLGWIDRGKGQVGGRYWTLDPIDGTKGFLRGDQYAIALALIEAGEIKLGVMACPALPLDLTDPNSAIGTLFVAVRGEGAVQMPLHGGEARPIRVASADRLIESVELDRGNPDLQRQVAKRVGLTAPPLPMDSLAKYGVVARGQAALYLRLSWTTAPDYRENIWDHAVGAIVVEEAGGRVSDMYGKALDFSAGAKLLNNRGIIASNGALHDAVLSVLRDQAVIS